MDYFIACDKCDMKALSDKLDRAFQSIDNESVQIICTDYKPMDEGIVSYAVEKHIDLKLFSPGKGWAEFNTFNDFKVYREILSSLQDEDEVILVGNSIRIQNLKTMASMMHRKYKEA